MRARCSRRFLILVRWLVCDGAVYLIAMVEVFLARHVWLATDRRYLFNVRRCGRHRGAFTIFQVPVQMKSMLEGVKRTGSTATQHHNSREPVRTAS